MEVIPAPTPAALEASCQYRDAIARVRHDAIDALLSLDLARYESLDAAERLLKRARQAELTGPAPCMGCRKPVWWHGDGWYDSDGRRHAC